MLGLKVWVGSEGEGEMELDWEVMGSPVWKALACLRTGALAGKEARSQREAY